MDGTDNTDFFEQKGTKETKEEFCFVAFVRFCANSVPMAAWMEDSESVKSVKSVVQFLWLRLAALRLLTSASSVESRFFAADLVWRNCRTAGNFRMAKFMGRSR